MVIFAKQYTSTKYIYIYSVANKINNCRCLNFCLTIYVHFDCFQMRSFHKSCWNIQGLLSSTFELKSGNPEFINSIKDVDIIVLTETWYQNNLLTHCPPGYNEVMVPSLKLPNIRKGRTSGGILVWYKEGLCHHISPVKQGKSYIWLSKGRSNPGHH